MLLCPNYTRHIHNKRCTKWFTAYCVDEKCRVSANQIAHTENSLYRYSSSENYRVFLSLGAWHFRTLKIMISLLFCVFGWAFNGKSYLRQRQRQPKPFLSSHVYAWICVVRARFSHNFGWFVRHRKQSVIDFHPFRLAFKSSLEKAYGKGHNSLVAMIFKWEPDNDLSVLWWIVYACFLYS